MLILKFAKGMQKITTVSDRNIERVLKERLSDYRATLQLAIEQSFRFVAGYKVLDPTSYYSNEAKIISTVKNAMTGWWGFWTPFAEIDVGKAAYKDIRELSHSVFQSLFNVSFKRIPDDKVPDPSDPDSTDSIDLSTGNVEPTSEAKGDFPKLTLNLGQGGIDSEYERLLRSQFDTRIDPRNRITTFSATDIARIENEMVRGLRQGVDTAVIRKRLVNSLGRDIAGPQERARLSSNLRRILRTTHQNASISAAFQSARMNPVVVGLQRHTGPRPCVACIGLAGTIYKTRQEFRDHPNGQCFVTFVMKTPEQLGIDLSTASPLVQRAWKSNVGLIPNRKYQFLKSPEKEQRKVFANNSLFDLWKQEKFPIEAIAVNKKGMFVQGSYVEILSKLHEIGGISYPLITYPTAAALTQWNTIIDPKDRVSSRLVFSETQPAEELNRFGFNRYPDAITTDMVTEIPDDVKFDVQRILAGFVSVRTLPYYAYNDLARVLNLGVRKATNGSVYYVKNRE